MTVLAEQSSTAIMIPIGGRTWLKASIVVPRNARGLVLFAHASGSSRNSPRNRYVASELNGLDIATILADLFTDEEERLDERTGEPRFDIPLLTDRVVRTIDWAGSFDTFGTLPIGLFGASTGAAAALDAAAERPGMIDAVVCRGGRPDLATRLGAVHAPTLFIVGARDTEVLSLNEDALRQLKCLQRLEVIPHATHLFEEPGALEAVASAAGFWFQEHLCH